MKYCFINTLLNSSHNVISNNYLASLTAPGIGSAGCRARDGIITNKQSTRCQCYILRYNNLFNITTLCHQVKWQSNRQFNCLKPSEWSKPDERVNDYICLVSWIFCAWSKPARVYCECEVDIFWWHGNVCLAIIIEVVNLFCHSQCRAAQIKK